MKLIDSLLAFLLCAGIWVACGTDDSGKDKCRNNDDCTGEFTCNLERDDQGTEAEIGQCMKATLDGFFLCTTENPCPKGQFCFNGLCAPGCMTDDNCADNQYCDTKMEHSAHMCVNKEVPTCQTKDQCAETQDCIKGFCSAITIQKECTLRPDGQDGCDQYSVCLDLGSVDQEELSCYTFPPCPEDGICPVGPVGSVCNENDIPNKARICLTGLCKSIDNCPDQFRCVIPTGSPLGMCSNGMLGAACMTKTECQDGLDCLIGSGMPIGFCIPGMGFGECESKGGSCIDPMEACPEGSDPDLSKPCSNMMQTCCI